MDHLSDGRLLAFLDGELPERETRAARRHLEDCESCGERLEALRATSEHLSRELGALDVPPPELRLPALEGATPGSPTSDATASAGARGPASSRASSPRRRLLIAAMLLLAFTGIGLAAVPGSPVRGWIEGAAERVAVLFAPEDVGVAATSTETPEPGVGVRPDEGGIRITISNPAPRTVLRVRLIQGERATVRAPGARYRTAAGRLEVLEAGPGEILLELPEQIRSARVEVDGETVLTRRNGELRFRAPSIDSTGGEFSFPLEPSYGAP